MQSENESESEDDDYKPECDAEANDASDDDELAEDVASDEDCVIPKDGKKKKNKKGSGSKKGKRPASSSKSAIQPLKRRGGIQLSDEEGEIPKPISTVANDDGEDDDEEEERHQRAQEDAAKKEEEIKASSAATSAKVKSFWEEMQEEENAAKARMAAAAASSSTLASAVVSTNPIATAPKTIETVSSKVENEEEQRKREQILVEATRAALAAANGTNRVTQTSAYTIVEKLDFAGEQVTVKKTIELGSKEDIQRQKTATTQAKKGTGTKLDDLVAQVTGKKKKCNTLEKSSSDWESFKDGEKLHEELEHYRKDGYLQKVAFLDRTAARQDEILRGSRRTTNNSSRTDLY